MSEEDLAFIVARLEAEEKDHAEIKKAAADAIILAEKVKAEADKVAAEFRQQLIDLENKLSPLIEIAPTMRDFAATGRVGYMLGKWAIGIAGFLSAAAVIYYGIVHGFRK